jgi:hypothetical protein
MMFSKLHRVGFLIVAAVPALMGADGNGCNGCAPDPPGTGGTSGGGACAAQDADLTTTIGECINIIRYRWDGYGCIEDIGCEANCRGRDCDQIYESRADCQAAYSTCSGYVCDGSQLTKIVDYLAQHQSCSTDADCTTASDPCVALNCPLPVNTSASRETLDFLLVQNRYCTTGSSERSCLTLCPDPKPVACVNGVCAARPAAQ